MLPPLDSSLVFTFCPRCDYSLIGLPETGICPECGDSYNRDFLILRGKPVVSGEEPNGQRHWFGRKLIWEGISYLPSLVLYVAIGMPGFIFVVSLSAFALMLIEAALIAVGSVRNNEMLVWISPMGLGQQPIVDPASTAGKCLSYFSPVISVGAITLLLIWAIAVGFAHTDLVMLAIAVASILFFVSYLRRSNPKSAPVLPAQGIRPALLPWSAFGLFEVEDLGGGTFQFWARRLNSMRITKSDVIKIEFNASAAGAAQLVDLIRWWTNPAVPARFIPLDRSPGPRWPRRAGLFVSRFVRSKSDRAGNAIVPLRGSR